VVEVATLGPKALTGMAHESILSLAAALQKPDKTCSLIAINKLASRALLPRKPY